MPSLSAFSRLTIFFLAGGLFLTGQIALVCMTGFAPRLRVVVESTGSGVGTWLLLGLPLGVFIGFVAHGVDEWVRHGEEHRKHASSDTRGDLARRLCAWLGGSHEADWLLDRHRLRADKGDELPTRLPDAAVWDLEGHAIVRVLAHSRPGAAERLVRVQCTKQLAGAYLPVVILWLIEAVVAIVLADHSGYLWVPIVVGGIAVPILWWTRNWNHEFFWRFAFRLAMTPGGEDSAPDRRESPVA